jgi:nitrite reductase/ring-hydroxylating ferredoxin subunit
MATAIARHDELAPGTTKKFLLQRDGQELEGFLVNAGGVLHAWVNRCRHVPMSLDWVDNQFFTADGRFLQCATHGAYYLPDTGECVAGPPCGKALHRVPITVADGVVVAEWPDGLPDD